MAKLNIDAELLSHIDQRRRERNISINCAAPTSLKQFNALVIQPTPAFGHQTCPPASTQPLLTPPRTQIRETASTTPHPPVGRRNRAPLINWEPFVAVHRARDIERRDYLQHGPRNRPTLNRTTLSDLEGRAALFLPANNMVARIDYARLTAEHLARFTEALPPADRVFFVTLVRRDHAVPLDEAAAFEVARVTGWTHHLLRGASYLGMIEGAYHTTLAQFGLAGRRGISWHSHAIVWGIDEVDLASRVDAANERYPALIPGLTPAHYRPLRRDEIFGRGLYICKGQINEYRAWPRKRTVLDTRTGKDVKVRTGRYTLKKRDLRPRDAVHACRAFVDRTIDALAFAAGDGRDVLRAIQREALAKFHRWEAGQSYMRRPRGGPPPAWSNPARSS